MKTAFPRVFVFEGAHGSGKTTLANKLAAGILKMGHKCVVYRPFRTKDIHRPTDKDFLKQYGMPLNTWQEDMFIADVLSVSAPNAHIILDRSMPSALAYDTGLTEDRKQVLLKHWAERMKWLVPAVVLVQAHEAVMMERAGRRDDPHDIPVPNEHRKLEGYCQAAVEYLQFQRPLYIARTDVPIDQAFDALVKDVSAQIAR